MCQREWKEAKCDISVSRMASGKRNVPRVEKNDTFPIWRKKSMKAKKEKTWAFIIIIFYS